MNEAYRKGIEHFNRREFFECHEVLEDVWFAESGAGKRFYQGLIQVAVAFHHYENANYRGALKLINRGIEKLEPYAPAYGGLELEALLADLKQWRAKFQAHMSVHGQPPELKIPTLVWQADPPQV